jgi:opacity protein-like surface antigen
MFDGILKNMATDLARKGLIAFAAYLASVGVLPSTGENDFVAACLALLAVAWSWYEKIGQQKVTDALKTVTGRTTIAAATTVANNNPSAMAGVRLLPFIAGALLFGAHYANAADLIPTKAPPSTTTQCTIIQCTGFYAGGGFAGNGTNADILGSGLSGSVFGAGAIPFVDAGWQYWNSKLFIAAEVGVGNQLNMGGLNINNENGVFAYQEIQIGGSLYGLFGAQTAPITVPQTLTADLIAPYVAMGIVERPFGNGWQTGAGAKFTIAPNTFLDIGYRYINYGSATVGVGAGAAAQFNAENLVRLSINYKF